MYTIDLNKKETFIIITIFHKVASTGILETVQKKHTHTQKKKKKKKKNKKKKKKKNKQQTNLKYVVNDIDFVTLCITSV